MDVNERMIFERIGDFISNYADKYSNLTEYDLLYEVGYILNRISIIDSNIHDKELTSRLLALGNLAMTIKLQKDKHDKTKE